jgi:integrase/recombinase XerC
MQTIQQFINYLLAEKGYSQATALAYRIALVDLYEFCQRNDALITWNTLDKDVLRLWMAKDMEQGNTARTVNKKMSAVRSFYRYLLRMEYINVDPTAQLKNPKVERRLPTFVKEQEMDRLFDEVEFGDEFEDERDRLILLTFYSTGLRLSELLGLKVSDVDLVARELKVLGKRNKHRVVPFGEELSDAFEAFFKRRSAQVRQDFGEVFLRSNGKVMTPVDVRRVVKKYLSCVTQQQKRSPHVLRHTYATVMLNNGADLEAVKELLGHESIATTEVYTHTTFAELKKAYEKAHPRA